MKGFNLFLILASLISLQAFASEVSETFSTRERFESGTAIWNQALGKIHPSLQVVNYKAGATALPFSVGDGSHGSFSLANYAKFSVGGDISGNKIRFDTARFPILQVTDFHLAPGWVLEPVGNNPLVIYSLSSVRIEGEIWCHGRDGGNASGATPGLGGTGRCGGKAGGDGGAVGQSGSNGEDAGTNVNGGQGGHATGATAVGGGGGGAWSGSAANPGINSSLANGGLGGSNSSEPEFLTIAGGAGGGGGSGTLAEAGAGGGAGGGVVIIHSVGNVEIGTAPASLTGYIYAGGGKGGDSSATAAPGGGGGGGSVQIYSGANIETFNTDGVGASLALHGNAGGNPGATSSTGSDGRSWLASVAYNTAGTGTYSPSEEWPVVSANNTVEFSNSAQSVITQSFDLESTLATLNSLTLTPTSADYVIELKGSADNFLTDDTGWTTDLASVSRKRFLKMKITVTTSTPALPTMLDQVRLDYTPGSRKDFQFKTSGCGTTGSGSSPGSAALWLFLLPLGFWWHLMRQSHRRAKRS